MEQFDSSEEESSSNRETISSADLLLYKIKIQTEVMLTLKVYCTCILNKTTDSRRHAYTVGNHSQRAFK